MFKNPQNSDQAHLQIHKTDLKCCHLLPAHLIPAHQWSHSSGCHDGKHFIPSAQKIQTQLWQATTEEMWAETSDTPHKGAADLSHSTSSPRALQDTKCHLWVCLLVTSKDTAGKPNSGENTFLSSKCTVLPLTLQWPQSFLDFADESVAFKKVWALLLPASQLFGYIGQHPNNTNCSQDSAMHRFYQIYVFTCVKAHL